VVVNLISATKTSKGLNIQAELDTGRYPKGRKITDQKMAPADFHGEWNYTISPRKPLPMKKYFTVGLTEKTACNP
jgi:hypothetical protein